MKYPIPILNIRSWRRMLSNSSARSISVLRLLLPILLLAGCTTVGVPYAPESSLTARADLKALKAKFASETSISEYYKAAETQERRNEFIAGRLVLYDLAYADWISRFRFGRATESTIFDTATLGITQSIALFGGERTKEVLGAIGAALVGVRSSYEKNFFDEQAAGAITVQMNAERKAALVPIVAGMKAPIDQYPLTAALVDLTNYQYAGTIDGALAGIQKEAGIKEARAEAQLDQYREVTFAPDTYSDRIRQWIWPRVARFDSATGKAFDKNNVEIIADDNNVTALEDELEKLGLGGLPIETFLDSPSLSQLRLKAISDLKIS